MGKERLSDENIVDEEQRGSLSAENSDSVTSEDTSIPKSVYFIIGNEFCERFSFYGMKAVLYLYLTQYLLFPDEPAKIVYHAFVMFAYFTTLFGAILADSYLGKFKTIFLLSIIYCIGNIVLSVTSFPGTTGNPPHWWGMAVGLLLLSVGTGGIKPCVSSFGGDQFRPDQVRGRSVFFNMFYFSINAGSLLSMLITPNIRENVKCFGSECFPMAFGIPAFLMIIATVVFVMGYRFYRHVPLGENVVMKVLTLTFHALRERRRAFNLNLERQEHWLYYASDRYSRDFLDDVRKVFSVLTIFFPISFFWMVYDQQGSTWTAQAKTMQYRLNMFGTKVTIAPDSMQVVNAIFILLTIPLFEKFIYPGFKAIGFQLYPLRRIAIGLILAIVSFCMSGALQLTIDAAGKADDIGSCPNDNCISILWQIPQYIILTFAEVMVSITGLEFAYSQAPESMKSLCQAVWLLMVALGNLLVILFNVIKPERIIVGVTTHKEFWQTIIYSVLLMIAFLFFVWIASNYKSSSASSSRSEDSVESESRITSTTFEHGNHEYQIVTTKVDD